jgi:lactaldehyde dehydrogenase/glycolaldehyde dehydrogenase
MKLAQAIADNAEALAQTECRDTGKPLNQARADAAACARYFEYYAGACDKLHGETLPYQRGYTVLTLREPHGVTGHIIPWNYPMQIFGRSVGAALAAGNACVVKPAEDACLSLLAIAELAAGIGLPPGALNVVTGFGHEAGAALSAHKDVGLISFTGSVGTGMRIMEAASRNLTRVNLELGGKAPAIVLDDADLELTANALFNSRVLNTGQVCNAAERVYVQRGIAEALADRVTRLMAETRYGNPLTDSGLHMGPLMNRVGLDKVAALVESAKAQGAQVLTGGRVADRPGFHYEPTVLVGCKDDMDVMTKEIFGPVLPIRVVDDLDEALALANDSDYGLTSSVFTQNLNAAMKAARELRFGETYINREHFEAMQGFHAGRRKSGIGGADGKHGLYEYTETQVVYLQTA